MNYLERLKKLEAEMAAPVAGTPVRWLEAVRAIIAELERQEPVAHSFRDMLGNKHLEFGSAIPAYAQSFIVPLYAAPPLPSISREQLVEAFWSQGIHCDVANVERALESLGIKVT